MMLPLMNCLIQVRRVAFNGQVARRVESVTEIIDIDRETQEPTLVTRFKWNAETDTFAYNKPNNKDKSVFHFISQINQINIDTLHEELERREVILQWMVNVGVKNYDDVANIIRNYYHSPEDVYNVARLGIK